MCKDLKNCTDTCFEVVEIPNLAFFLKDMKQVYVIKGSDSKYHWAMPRVGKIISSMPLGKAKRPIFLSLTITCTEDDATSPVVFKSICKGHKKKEEVTS